MLKDLIKNPYVIAAGALIVVSNLAVASRWYARKKAIRDFVNNDPEILEAMEKYREEEAEKTRRYYSIRRKVEEKAEAIRFRKAQTELEADVAEAEAAEVAEVAKKATAAKK